MPDAPDNPRIVADKYLLGPMLGRGAVGEVYLARHRLTGAEVALKLIPSRLVGSTTGLQRFHREVSVANRIGHPGMVRVHDAGWSEVDDTYYLAMERLIGQSLGAWTQSADFDAWRGVEIVRAMLEPLAAAHAAGIVHRDLKPDNVFLHHDPHTGQQVVKLLDFGIARDQRELQSATLADITLGTPAFMSPEQATSARDATPASDVWSVGIMLYRLYAGRLPFDDETIFNTLTAICTSPHPPLQATNAKEQRLIAVIDRCLCKDPAGRFGDAGLLAAALDVCLEAEPRVAPAAHRPRADTDVHPFSGAEPIGGLTMLPAPTRPFGAKGLALLVLILISGVAGWRWLRGSEEHEAPQGSSVVESSSGLRPTPAAPAPPPPPTLVLPLEAPTPTEAQAHNLDDPRPAPAERSSPAPRRTHRSRGVEDQPGLGGPKPSSPTPSAEQPTGPTKAEVLFEAPQPPPGEASAARQDEPPTLAAPAPAPRPAPPPPPAEAVVHPKVDAPPAPAPKKPAVKKPFATF